MDYEAHWNHIDSHFWAWLAGFIDGDGCIGAHKGGKTSSGTQMYPLRITISQKDRTILDQIRDILGAGNISRHNRTLPVVCVHYSLRFGPAISRTLCKFIQPHLRIKQQQAIDAMQFRRPNNG